MIKLVKTPLTRRLVLFLMDFFIVLGLLLFWADLLFVNAQDQILVAVGLCFLMVLVCLFVLLPLALRDEDRKAVGILPFSRLGESQDRIQGDFRRDPE